MTNQYYELHVTFTGPLLTERPPYGWTYSRIDGDPTLGAGVKQYLTAHRDAGWTLAFLVKSELTRAAEWLEQRGLSVLRRKVELVVHDDRSSSQP